MGHDPNLQDKIAVTVIATGFNHKEIPAEIQIKKNEPEKIYVRLGENSAEQNPAPASVVASPVDLMAPTLVEMPTSRNNMSFEPKPAFPVDASAKEVFKLELKEASVPEQKIAETAPVTTDTPEEKAGISLVIKNEPVTGEAELRIGSHYLTPDEIAEKRRFEDQKRALEERAERLRKMSFNIKGTESTDELENVPAYVRRQVELDNSVASADKFYSGYSVGVNDQQNPNQASIQTINTFLDGKKPD
jgi:cell division protein FtsZ